MSHSLPLSYPNLPFPSLFFAKVNRVKFNILHWPKLGKKTVVYIKWRGQVKKNHMLGQSLLRRVFAPNLTKLLTMAN